MVASLLQTLQLSGRIRALDQAFGEFINAQSDFPCPDPDQYKRQTLVVLSAFLSCRMGEQDSCIDILSLGQPFADLVTLPAGHVLMQILSEASCVWQVGEGDPELADKPLVLDGTKLYLQRYWHYETSLAGHIRRMAGQSLPVDQQVADDLLLRLFGPEDKSESEADQPDGQRVAVNIAAARQFSVITGGPGTGKTTTVTRLLALLQGLALAQNKQLNIQLVAPTGKAAARLTESINSARLHLPEDLQQNLPAQCSTVHRLLGARPNSPYFKHNQHNPLHLDVLVLDEASMVDLPLMSKLFAALPEHAQLVLLGDKDQLSSVESGSVLSDICQAAIQGNTICHNVAHLTKSHRFSADSGIGRLAVCINQGLVAQTLEVLIDPNEADVNWRQDALPEHLISELIPILKDYFSAVKQGDIAGAFACLQRQQVLCAQKSGDWGVQRLNQQIEVELHKQGVIDKFRDFYVGRPVMISQNDHRLKLFNGDVGIVMPDPSEQRLLKVWFISPEGHIRGVLPSRLPPQETLYAMTIHKSQGSEFEQVYLCLPASQQSAGGRGLSRELLYTGLTRAKHQFTLYGSQQALKLSLTQQCLRGSGLTQRLL